MMKRFFIILAVIMISVPSMAQKEKKYAREGNSLYKSGDFQKAEIEYRRALEKNPLSNKVIYNLGNTLFKEKKAEDAVKAVTPVLDSIQDPVMKSAASYNIGNYDLSLKKYQEAIDSYKNSLRLNPTDMAAKSNLAYAQKMLKNQKDKQKNNQNKDQNNKNNQDKDKNKNNDQNKNNKDQNKDKSKNNQQPDINQQNADQMLQAIQNKENQTQEKVKKEKAQALAKKQPDKNW